VSCSYAERELHVETIVNRYGRQLLDEMRERTTPRAHQGAIDMWVSITGLNGLYYESTHILRTKQKFQTALFLSPNVERSHSILIIWNRMVPFFHIPEPNTT
jgi:hypothetical protein